MAKKTKQMPAQKTNSGKLKDLIKALENAGVLGPAILVERILAVSDMTRKAISKDPTPFDTPLCNHYQYLAVCDIIDAHLKK